MVTENKRKNMDYSNSAVNLVNPESLHVLLERYKSAVDYLNTCTKLAQESIPDEIKKGIEVGQMEVAEINEQIHSTIDAEGSYQNLVTGAYAIKQRKVLKSYNAEQFEHNYPMYAPAVIIKAVDTTKLNGLIKGGLITEDSLKDDKVITEKESFVYIIKTE